MSHFSNVQNWHSVLSLLEKDCGLRNSPLWGCWIYFFFFAFKDVSAFLVDMLGKMCQRLEAMWSKPRAIGCFRVCEGCLLIVHQRTLLLSFMYWPIITISWSWMIFLAEPIKSTGQVNQALEYLSSCVLWPSFFCIGSLCFTFLSLLTSALTAPWSECSQKAGLPFRAWDQTSFRP